MVSLPVDAGRVRYAIQVAMSLDDAYAVLRFGRWLFLGMSLVILTGIGLTGAMLARRALRPIDEMVTRARRIGEANLVERLPHPGPRDEIGRLGETLNDMLDRLERSFEVQRRFTADASHELRSPLSRLRAELEVTLRRPRPPGEYEETLRSCLDEVQRVQGLIEELLGLARIDARQEPEPAKPIAVSEIVEAAVAAVRPEAERRGVTVAVERPPELLVNAAPGAAKGVAEQIEPEHREHDRGAREEEDPPRAAGEVPVRIGEHRAPLGRRRLRAEPEKPERGGLQDRERDRERRLHDQGRQAVRNDVAQDDAPPAPAEAQGRDHELLLAPRQHGAPAQARVDRNRDEADREQRVTQAGADHRHDRDRQERGRKRQQDVHAEHQDQVDLSPEVP